MSYKPDNQELAMSRATENPKTIPQKPRIDRKQQVLLQRIELLYSQLPLSAMGSLAVATVTLFVFFDQVDSTYLMGWYALHAVITGLRLWIYLGFKQSSGQVWEIESWHRHYVVGALISGLAWGSTVILMETSQGQSVTLFTTVVLAGVTAAALTTMAFSAAAYLAFTLPLLSCYAAWALTGSNDTPLGLFIVTLLYIVILTAAARHFGRSLIGALRLHEEKRRLSERLAEDNDRLQRAQDQILRDQRLAGHVMSNILAHTNFSRLGIRHHLEPLDDFNGDVLLAGTTRHSALRILLGDITGHGLSAAIGAIPVAQTFRAMNRKGLNAETLVKELNRNLCRLLPVNMFMGAILIELIPLSSQRLRARIWNGAMEDALILRGASNTIEHATSRHLALGIIEGKTFSSEFQEFILETGDFIYAVSDGITEATNDQRIQFGRQRLEEALINKDVPGSGFERAFNSLTQFRDGAPTSDDQTFVEIPVAEVIQALDVQVTANHDSDTTASMSTLLNVGVR